MVFKAFKSFTLFLLIDILGLSSGGRPSAMYLTPSHDTFVRRDRGDVFYGSASKVTITQKGANQRIGFMKFDTSTYVRTASATDATLKLTVAEKHTKPVQVSIFRMVNDFDENNLSWDTFDGAVHSDHHISFTVYENKPNQAGEVDVSSLLRDGEDMALAFVVEEGHVKFHSKDDNDESLIPKLILKPRNPEF
jgi:hypothetical protein